MLRFLFGPRAAPMTIHHDNLFTRLGLGKHLQPDPKSHIPVLRYLGEYSLRGSFHHGPAMSYFSKPTQTITIKPDPQQFSDEPPGEDEYIRSSAHIAITTEPRRGGSNAFYLMISKGGRTLEELDRSLIFGLKGVQDKDGHITIKRIMAPGMDNANRLTDLQKIPLTPEYVNTALKYAARCAANIYANSPVYASINLNAALGRIQADEPDLS